MRPSRLLLFLLGLALSLGLVGGADAQTEQIDEVRAERDAARAELARMAADLDPLKAANAEIEEAVLRLTEELAAKAAAHKATLAQLGKARNDITVAQAHVATEQRNIAELTVQLQQQAVYAYVRPRSETVGEDVLSSDDINDGERRRAVLAAVSTTQEDILDRLRVAQAKMELAVSRAQGAERDIAEREQLAAVQYGEVRDAIADQQRLQLVLEERIAAFQAEVDAHALEGDRLAQELAGLIAEEEARQEAIREAARIQAERERVAREQAAQAAQRAADIAAGRIPADQAVDQSEAALFSAPSAGPGSLTWPVQGVLTSRFGPRWGRMHNGVDLAANTGTPVIAAASGQVISAGYNGGFGNLVLIDHGGGFVTAYAHLNSINVGVGQSVGAGNSVGTVGNTGNSTGPHLHFETRVNGVAYDPLQYLS